MVGTIRTGAAALLVVLAAVAGPAGAWGWWGCYAPAYRVAWYYPTYYYPIYCPPVHAPLPPQMPYAQPRPAPPSKEAVVPKASRAPEVTESRFSATDRCKVGFWNVTGQDVTLTVNGKTHVLPRNRAITLDLGRTFAWRLGNDDPRTVEVPADRATFEVLLRPASETNRRG